HYYVTLPLFFTHPAPTSIYTLSLHDALPICHGSSQLCDERLLHQPDPGADRTVHQCRQIREEGLHPAQDPGRESRPPAPGQDRRDRKSTRLNSSHSQISYAVFCLKKKTSHVY